MRKVYVDLLCGGFTMLCAFFVYHNFGYKGSNNLGRERFNIDALFSKSYSSGYDNYRCLLQRAFHCETVS